MTNREVVTEFLTAYGKHEPERMSACLDADAEFSDIAFHLLKGDDVRMMWRWFCRPHGDRLAPVEVPGFDIVKAEGDCVWAQYWVRYCPRPGRNVNYVIASRFTLRDGKIIRQQDTPTISKLELGRMAFGFPGLLLARRQSRKMRERFESFKVQMKGKTQ